MLAPLHELASRGRLAATLADLTDPEVFALPWTWRLWARPEQVAPPGDWSTWIYLAGRGSGKTRSAAEWLLEKRAGRPGSLMAAIGATTDETRKVMFHGESGIIARCPPWDKPHWNTCDSSLDFSDGTRIFGMTAENPEQPRGFQFHFAWADEVAKWRGSPKDCLENLEMALRLGENPQLMITTTPKPIALLRDLVARPNTVISRGRTLDNAANLPKKKLAAWLDFYRGTRLGQQEMDGVLFEEADGALWRSKWISDNALKCDLSSPSAILDWLSASGRKIRRIAIGLDPSTTSKAESDECGICVAGEYSDARTGDRHCVVLHDGTAKLSPEGWGRRVVELYRVWQADVVRAETNMGGECIRNILRMLDPDCNVRETGGNRGKRTRAEPVAALYEKGRVHHLGTLKKLEQEMLTFTLDMSARKSPNAMDAMAYAVGELLLHGTFTLASEL